MQGSKVARSSWACGTGLSGFVAGFHPTRCLVTRPAASVEALQSSVHRGHSGDKSPAHWGYAEHDCALPATCVRAPHSSGVSRKSGSQHNPRNEAPGPESGQPEIQPPSALKCSLQLADYERFNRSNLTIHYWSRNYRGCWHRTCPPVASQWGV